MQDKEGVTGIAWIVILAIACWGGIVRYIIDTKKRDSIWRWTELLAQMVVSGFTGVIGGLLAHESGMSQYMMYAISGVFGSMGSIALSYFWERLTGIKNENQQ